MTQDETERRSLILPGRFVLLAAMRDLEYFLPVSKDCLDDCDLCESIGCRNPENRSQSDFLRALNRGLEAGFKNFLMPFHFLNWSECAWAIEQFVAKGLGFRMRLRPKDFLDYKVIVNELRGRGLRIEWVIDARDLTAAARLKDVAASIHAEDTLTIVVLRGHQCEKILADTPVEFHSRFRFYFPIPVNEKQLHLNPYEVFKLGRLLTTFFPQVVFKPPPNYEIWEPRATHEFGFEASHVSNLDRSHAENPQISVIIPTYNNRDYLLATLDHLVAQNLDPSQFEVVVVDDGSTDGTGEALADWLKQIPSGFNFKHIFFPRRLGRQMGDSLYRAGIARNLGVKRSSGQILAFLDSDILTPPHYLSDLIERHKRVDVVQSVRLNLKEAVSSRFTHYEDIDSYRHTEPFEGKYWLDFYSEPNWSDLPYYWKYTCTYGLSLPRKVFESIGRIRRTFIYYGFEDTDLGYRLAESGYKFELSDAITYHLFHTPNRSEYRNSAEERHRILCKTATIFYLNQLDPKIFSHFHGFYQAPGVMA